MKSDQTLGAIFVESMKIWDQLKASGASFPARVKSLETVLRAHWPFTREWKFVCSNCDDVGLVMLECPGDASCGRPRQHGPHTYGSPCWCALGNKFKDKPPAAPEDFAQAGRVRKPTRMGR